MISDRQNRKNIKELLTDLRSRSRYYSCGDDCKTTQDGTKHSMRCSYFVTVGSRWKEVDSRFVRLIEIVKISGQKVHIKTIGTDRVTVAKLERFNGKSHGYRLLGGRCHKCQIAAGAVVPKGGHRGITVSLGICGGCLDQNATLVPSSDYHWPKEGRKAVFD